MNNQKVNNLFRFVVSLVTVTTLAVGVVGAGQPFTLVTLPDTQNYTEEPSNRPLFSQQTQWIADQVELAGNPRNIQFVTHLGDIVNYGSSLNQWQVADGAMGILDGVVKYSVLPGNHDYDVISNKSAGTSHYLDNFGPDRFAGRDWYGGSDPSGNNSFQRFSAGGYNFLHLALEWRPAVNEPFRATSPIAWAQSVLDAHPQTPVILSTHENLVDIPGGRSSFGEDLWNQLVRKNDQVFMVLNGHYQRGEGPSDGEYHQVSLNDAGRPVFEVLQNFQDYPDGGEGWLRLINFDIPNNQIAFETYSPVLEQFQTERIEEVGQYASQFEFGVNFSSRLQPVPKPDFVFRNGEHGYFGTLDKELRASGGDNSNGQYPAISIDSSDGPTAQQPNHGLLRFADLIGTGVGQLPSDAAVERAVLTLEIVDSGSGFALHEMLSAWDENSTWQAFGAGVQANGVEAALGSLASMGANNSNGNVPVGTLEIDVTSTIKAYLQGSLSNYGWALLPFDEGTNGLDFFTGDYGDLLRRPSLQVFLRGPTGDVDRDGDIDGSDFLRWQRTGLESTESAADFAAWQANFGLSAYSVASSTTVPEPTTWAGLLGASFAALALRPLRPALKKAAQE